MSLSPVILSGLLNGQRNSCRSGTNLFIQRASYRCLVIIKLQIRESIWGNKLLNVNLKAKCKIEVLTPLHKSV